MNQSRQVLMFLLFFGPVLLGMAIALFYMLAR